MARYAEPITTLGRLLTVHSPQHERDPKQREGRTLSSMVDIHVRKLKHAVFSYTYKRLSRVSELHVPASQSMHQRTFTFLKLRAARQQDQPFHSFATQPRRPPADSRKSVPTAGLVLDRLGELSHASKFEVADHFRIILAYSHLPRTEMACYCHSSQSNVLA
jgi:hypothetical protein